MQEIILKIGADANTPRTLYIIGSVADSGCLSRIMIFTHPGSQISDPGSKNSSKREG
jgi:hypothetical protein